jgi:hypothetical protein
VVDEDETMNGSYRKNVDRRCLPFGFVPRHVVARLMGAISSATTT